MSNSRVLSLHRIKPESRRISVVAIPDHESIHETLADHAKYFGASSRQRAKMVARELANRLHSSLSEAKTMGRSTLKQVGVRLAKRTSRELIKLADKIEQKALAVERKR
ncbi:MAG TPA: hypothetical protein VIE91_09445 [Methylophilaceae bacterium]